MRWLGALAVMLVGAAVYLYTQLSDGSATPSPRKPVASEPEPAPEAAKPFTTGSPTAAPGRAPIKLPVAPSDNRRPTVADTPAVAPTPEVVARPPAELGDPEVAWTEAERQQWLWTANGRFEKGNYPRALEAALEIARRNPDSAWQQDAWRVAIKSYCAMAEPEKAQALFAKMTDPAGIEEATKGCTEWNVKLAKSP